MTAVETETGTASAAGGEGELFDTSKFELPIPKLDGKRADKIVLAFGGSVELDRTDTEDLELLEKLMLGKDFPLAVTGKIAGKGFAYAEKGEDAEQVVTYRVALKIHSFDLPESSA